MDKRNNWLTCITAIIAAVLLSAVTNALASLIPQGNMSEAEYGTIVYLLAGTANFVGMTIILAISKRLDILKSIPKGSFIKGIGISIILVIYCIVTFTINTVSCIMSHSGAAMSPLITVIFISGLFMGAGIGEELMYRGVIMSMIRGAASYKSRKVLIIGMAVSSVAFGLTHLTNLFVTDDVIGTFGQVIYAIGVGFYLAAVYARTGNLWYNIVLHFFVDMASFIKTIFTSSEVTVSEILGGNQLSVIVISVCIGIVFFCMGMFIIRKSKMPELS
ncbi:MAG: CPBP family intramembrane metalloprotease [Lachnospiraceae bacterium]|nr:CPBP family intramembrane metalloprotease [Lachnospiraceae bacterium]